MTTDREAWLATMIDEELHLQPVQTPAVMRSAVVTIATLIGHLTRCRRSCGCPARRH